MTHASAIAALITMDLTDDNLRAMLTEDGIIADVKGMWRKRSLPANFVRWQL